MGRTEKSMGEDPYLLGALAVAFIRGMQGPDPNHWQAASLMKHFMANESENGRTYTSSDFDERLSVGQRIGDVASLQSTQLEAFTTQLTVFVNTISQKLDGARAESATTATQTEFRP